MNEKALEIINSVDWNSEYFGAWGVRVPPLLHRLLQLEDLPLDHKKGRDLMESLCSVIAYTGMVTEITASVIPVLITLLKDKSIQPKRWILEALGCIFFRSEITSDFPKEYANLHKQVYEGMKAGLPLFEYYLNHNDPQMRKVAGYILSNFTLQPDPAALWLCDRILIEENSDVKIALFGDFRALLTSITKGYDPYISHHIQSSLRPLLTSSNIIEQGEAAIIFFALQKKEIDTVVKNILAYCIQNMDELDRIESRLITNLDGTFRRIELYNTDLYIKELIPELPMEVIQKFMPPAVGL